VVGRRPCGTVRRVARPLGDDVTDAAARRPTESYREQRLRRLRPPLRPLETAIFRSGTDCV